MNSNQLKCTALIIMVIDHIAEFISDVPLWFHWIGRLSAPIFLFCCVWSFDYTRNRKKYLLRLYFAGFVMSFIQYFFCLSNNIFRTLFSLCLFLYVVDLYKNKADGKKYLLLYFLVQLLSISISIMLLQLSSNHENYQWMMIFSLFFILMYNGKEGKKHKWFFYIFYPAHILILCLVIGVN
jgi:hypothetical protein